LSLTPISAAIARYVRARPRHVNKIVHQRRLPRQPDQRAPNCPSAFPCLSQNLLKFSVSVLMFSAARLFPAL
jgi:hypothetical protein